jgi:hypothetical protein
MCSHAPATRGDWRSVRRERKRNQVSDKREQQQKSGGQSLHVFR